MSHHPLRIRAGLIIALILFASTVIIGCSEDSTTMAPGISEEEVSDIEFSRITEDPIDEILLSCDGYTSEEPGMKIDRLSEKLDLDEDQKEALISSYLEFRAAIIELRDLVRAGEITVEEARAQAVVLREAFEAAIKLILTPEQYDLLQEMKQTRDRIRDRIHAADKYVRWETWLIEISADSTQIEEVFLALDTMHEGIRDLQTQVKDGEITREEALIAANILREEFETALQTILTDEQYEALLELRPRKCNV